MKIPPERLGSFYLGAEYDLKTRKVTKNLINYDARDLTTHAICVGMTGSGKTGLCMVLLEEAALDKVPAIIIDPKGDITNMLLQFPDHQPEDFRPWVNTDDARRKSQTVAEYSQYIANLWNTGQSEWGIESNRIRQLQESADFTIFTPGSNAGIPISILNSLSAPHIDFDENAEILREQISGTVAALLSLVGIDVDPLRSQEAILLTTIFEHFWRRNEDLTLQKLIISIQNPPFRQLGVFDVDSYYPEKKRFELAMALNSLIASPSFQSWLQGESLNIDNLLYTSEGKPRHSIFYIAHLSDRERMFFVTLLLENVLMWVRRQTGTTSLRALLYFDEVFGFLPPVAEPPSKRPLLTLLKQARAFGLGVVLVTQNPVDIDYKGLTNAGTWFIGKLQAERDKDRVVQGLKDAIFEAGGSGERVNYDAIINELSSRIFLMHNVHEDRPVVFYTRWVMCYLRGPLTRPQVRQLMEVKKRGRQRETITASTLRAQIKFPVEKSSPDPQLVEPVGFSSTPPALDPSLTQVFLPTQYDQHESIALLSKQFGTTVNVTKTQLIYKSAILGSASVRFLDRKRNIDVKEDKILIAIPPENVGTVNWTDAEAPQIEVNELATSPKQVNSDHGPFFTPIHKQANSTKKIKRISKDLYDWLYYNNRLILKVHPTLEIFNKPGESEQQFIVRLQQAAREQRDFEVDKLEEKYASQLAKLEKKRKTLERDLAADEAEYDARKKEEIVGVGETVLSFFMGRRRTRAVTTIASKRRITSKVKREIEETQEEITELNEDMKKVENELKEAIDQIVLKWDKAQDDLTTEELKPRRTDINMHLVALAWLPHWLITYTDRGFPRVTTIPAYHHTRNP